MSRDFKIKGKWKKTFAFLRRWTKDDLIVLRILNQYGAIGVERLEKATPVDSGKTAKSWFYKIYDTGEGFQLSFENKNITDGYNVAVLIEYGHVTASGTLIKGKNFARPIIQEITKAISESIREEVSK